MSFKDYNNRTNRYINDGYNHKSTYSDTMFKVGKYIGKSISTIKIKDEQYFQWAIKAGLILKNDKGIYISK